MLRVTFHSRHMPSFYSVHCMCPSAIVKGRAVVNGKVELFVYGGRALLGRFVKELKEVVPDLQWKEVKFSRQWPALRRK
jgi:hypothetical protein